jgi:hypothetical protein
MRELRIRIELENDAFGQSEYESRAEVIRILDSLTDDMLRARVKPYVDEEGKLSDSNGNTVGEWRVIQTQPVEAETAEDLLREIVRQVSAPMADGGIALVTLARAQKFLGR